MKKRRKKIFFDSKENSILLSDLTQTIYDSLISIPDLDENLEDETDNETNSSNDESTVEVVERLSKNIK